MRNLVRYYNAGDEIPADIQRVDPPELQHIAVFEVPVRVEERGDGMHVYPLTPGEVVIRISNETVEDHVQVAGAPTFLHLYKNLSGRNDHE